MADSAAKRRKTSPTTAIPIDAPTTPSRIPVPRKDGPQSASRRPSFASPTKASLSRHNPQLLNRPTSSGGTGRPASRGKDVQDVFAKAIGEDEPATQSVITGEDRDGSKSMSTTQENDPSVYDVAMTQKTPPRALSRGPIGGGLSAKPRRLSRSPIKRPERPPFEYQVPDALQDDFNPFQKKGLRRSPISSSARAPVAPVLQDSVEEENANPFRKTGLRRSPVPSLPTTGLGRSPPVESYLRRSPTPPQPSRNETVKSPVRSQPVETGVRKSPFPSRSALRRSPVFSLPVENVQETNPLLEQSETREEPKIPIPPAEAAPLSRRLFAEISREQNIPRPENISSEIRRQVQQNPVESILQPKKLFAEIPRDTEEQIIAPAIAQESTFSITPAEPLRRPSNVAEVTEENQHQPEPATIPKTTQNQDVSKMREAVQDLFTGARRVEEPELPPTPTQLGIPDPVVTTPPTGIHDTPSKRARRNKALGAKLKSSPLKPRDLPPHEPPKPVPKPELKAEKPKRRKSARFLIPEDPHASKKKSRDDLLRELQQLQADVALANQENERLRIRLESRKKGVSAAPNPDELQAMLLRSMAPEPFSDPAKNPPSIFKSIKVFLPFRPRRKQVVTPVSEKPLPSHLPIALNDPLPYLQAFSPLTYTSTISLLPSDPPSHGSSSQIDEQLGLQRHVITASHPSGFFSTRISMTVDTSSLTIAALEVLRLDMNAEKELGTFIRARARSESALGKDITVVCWAMSRWIEVSIQRARFWCAIEHEFGTPEARAKALQKKRKRKRQQDDGSAAKDKEVDKDEENQKWTRRQLLPQIGRTGIELADEDVELRFEWRILFDWTGEVESVISAGARLPRTWEQADDRSSLAKVPDTFDKLVKERGPLGAVRATVGIFMPVS